MEHPEIRHLYKYYAYNENSPAALINRRVWFPKPESFNDPFDCDIDFEHRIRLEHLKMYLQEEYKDLKGISEKQVEDIELGILN